MLAASFFSPSNWLDVRGVVSGLIISAVAAVASLQAARYRRDKQITVRVVYDGPINKDARRFDGGSVQDPSLWRIISGNREVVNGRQVVLNIKNTGAGRIIDKEPGRDWDEHLTFSFDGWEIVNFKIRDNDALHRAIKPPPDRQTPIKEIVLAPLELDPGGEFNLLVLLEDKGGAPKAITRQGRMDGGRITDHRQRSTLYRIVIVGAALVVLLAGVTGGLLLSGSNGTDEPTCATGTLELVGSTAFAPIATAVVNQYQDHCPGADITITPSNSADGVSTLIGTRRPDMIAMSDGQAPGATALQPRPVGVLFYAMVASQDLHIRNLSTFEIQQTYGGDPLTRSATGYLGVGRPGGSGTRTAFDQNVLHGTSVATNPCEPPPAPLRTCTEDTTTDVLGFVDKTSNAIGYAEADAILFYPKVRLVTIDGVAPTRAATLKGKYHFVATEYLYTSGTPRGLTASFINYITSDAGANVVRNLDFIGCTQLKNTAISDNCK